MTALILLFAAAVTIACAMWAADEWLNYRARLDAEGILAKPDPALFDQARLELVNDPLLSLAVTLPGAVVGANVIDFPTQRVPGGES